MRSLRGQDQAGPGSLPASEACLLLVRLGSFLETVPFSGTFERNSISLSYRDYFIFEKKKKRNIPENHNEMIERRIKIFLELSALGGSREVKVDVVHFGFKILL